MPDHIGETSPLVGAGDIGCDEDLGYGPSHQLGFAVPQETTRRHVDRLDGAVWCHDNEGVHERTENVLRIIFVGSGSGIVGLL